MRHRNFRCSSHWRKNTPTAKTDIDSRESAPAANRSAAAHVLPLTNA